MTSGIRLALVLHNHQPVGNFEHVFEAAFEDSYAPFLDVLGEFEEIPISLHVSGSLLEWLLAERPGYVDRLRRLQQRGQIEILGGPFYEPILAGIPRRDRVGQIAAFSDYLENLFGRRVRGMWVPERVWEPSFAADIAEAGIEYTLLDDYHFRNAGLPERDLHGYYLCEDEGRLLKIFPGSERLRYTIPFADPQASIDYLRGIAEAFPGTVVTFGDDGEKFGTWPETKKHVYEDGWLRRFLEALRANRDWLGVVTLSEAVDHVSPRGTCYLPDCSYREMTEWALPTDRQIDYLDLVHRKQHDPDWHQIADFVKGGFWRNFRVKYPEANEMYARMLEVSRRLEAAETLSGGDPGKEPDSESPAPTDGGNGAESLSRVPGTDPGLVGPRVESHKSGDGDESSNSAVRADLLRQARIELYRAQCNCAYWHGAFGGLYLPHLRSAVYRNLIAADSLLETAAGRSGRWVQIDVGDFNLDARKEIRLAGDRLVAYLAPGRGGHLYELDVRGSRHNLLAGLNRRPEPYHRKVIEAARHQSSGSEQQVASIHDMVRFKQPDLDQKLIYDNWPRKSLVDHFLQPGLSLETFQTGGGELGDFVTGVFETRIRRSPQRVEARMTRDGWIGPYRIRMTKIVALAAGSGSLDIRYLLQNLPAGVPLHFGVEFNFAGLAAGADDRYYYDADGRQLGRLETVHALEESERIGLVDEWLGLDVAVESSGYRAPTAGWSGAAGIWTFPIQTVSQSEGGFELVHQSCVVLPHWEFTAPADGRWQVALTLSIDTSAAQARQLRETPVLEPRS